MCDLSTTEVLTSAFYADQTSAFLSLVCSLYFKSCCHHLVILVIRPIDLVIRPIAVGSSLRRLAVKVGSRPIVQALGEELRPVQLGVSTRGGCEAAAHAARRYARDCRHRRVLLKIDMRNAFNSLRRDSFLSVARVRTPGLYSLLWQAYSSQTRLFFGEEGFASETGIQQGDPIGPALFALSVDEAARGVQSEFNVWYLDDATLGDSPERVYDDLLVLLERLRAIGLEVNGSKCELTILNDGMPEATEALFRGLLPGVRVVEACDLSLLGALVDIRGVPGTINEKREALERMTSKLEVLNPHQAILFCWKMPSRYLSCNMCWEHRLLTCVERSWKSSTGLFLVL